MEILGGWRSGKPVSHNHPIGLGFGTPPVGQAHLSGLTRFGERQTREVPADSGFDPLGIGAKAMFRDAKLPVGIYQGSRRRADMVREYGYEVWLPIVVTGAVWMGLIFAIAALVSRTWADLIGLLYLMASPFIYGALKSLLGSTTETTRDSLEETQFRKTGS